MTEYFEIITPEGHSTNIFKPRDEVHQKGLWHRAVNVWFLNSKHELLIQKRSAHKESFPNAWDISCAGHMSQGDTSMGAAIREVQEELGIKINESDLEFLFSLPYQYVIHNGKFINNEWNDVYLVKGDWDLKEYKLDPQEVAEVQFIFYKKLEQIIIQKSFDFVPHDEEYKKLFVLLHQRIKD